MKKIYKVLIGIISIMSVISIVSVSLFYLDISYPMGLFKGVSRKASRKRIQKLETYCLSAYGDFFEYRNKHYHIEYEYNNKVTKIERVTSYPKIQGSVEDVNNLVRLEDTIYTIVGKIGIPFRDWSGSAAYMFYFRLDDDYTIAIMYFRSLEDNVLKYLYSEFTYVPTK